MIPASASGLWSEKPCTICSRSSCGVAAAMPLSASASSRSRRPSICSSGGSAASSATSTPSGIAAWLAARAQNPCGSSSPSGGSSDGMNVSQSAASVTRWRSSNRSLVARAANVSPIACAHLGVVGQVVGVAGRRVAGRDQQRLALRVLADPVGAVARAEARGLPAAHRQLERRVVDLRVVDHRRPRPRSAARAPRRGARRGSRPRPAARTGRRWRARPPARRRAPTSPAGSGRRSPRSCSASSGRRRSSTVGR